MKKDIKHGVDLKDVWDFIEKYYPNYYSSNSILYLQDLEKVANRDYEVGKEDDSAWQLFLQLEQDCKESGEDLEDFIFNELERETRKVYEKAIQGYLDAQKEIDPIEQAKETLRKAGYFVENLWHVDDVKSKCNEKVQDNTALQILQDNVDDGWIISNINDGIESSLEARGYPLKGEED